MSVCPVCGKENQIDARFCSRCGGTISTRTGRLPAQTLLHAGRYMILKLLGQGGMGAVYQARDLQAPQKIVAVKEMSQSGLSGQELQEAIEAFAHEAELLARLDHASLPRIYQHFEEGGRRYLVMDFIEGETLEHYEEGYKQKGQRIPVESVLHIGIQLCRVMDYLHCQQPAIIFRDLKPANGMLTPQGKVCLIDFGIARLLKPNQTHDTLALGSPGYAPPEQYQRATTPRSDIYSLGAVLHQFLTGDDPEKNPFRFRPFSINVPLLEDLVMCMVDVDEALRPASMRSVQEMLERSAQIVLERKRGVQSSAMLTTSSEMKPVTIDVLLSQSAQDWRMWNALQGQLAPLVNALPGMHISVHSVRVEKGLGIQNARGADLTLVLLSEDFLNEQSCMADAKMVVDRVRSGDGKIVSLLLRACAWQRTELATVPLLLADPITHPSLYAQEQRIVEVVRRVFEQIMTSVLRGKHAGLISLLQWLLVQLYRNGEMVCPYFVVGHYVLKNVRRSGRAGVFCHLVDVRTSRAIADFVFESHTSARLTDLLRVIASTGTTPLDVYGMAMCEQPPVLKKEIVWI